MALNLSRNTRVWFTTNVNPVTGELPDNATGYSAFSSGNTYELQVLDGYSFTQGTNQQTITLNEAGTTPVRGQQSFNTALNPVDFSFSTYIRPQLSTNVTCIERVLWNALTSARPIDTTTGIEVTSVARATNSATLATVVATVSTAWTTTAAALGVATMVGEAINLQGSSNAEWNISGLIASVNGATVTVNLSKAPNAAAGTSATGTVKAYTGSWAPGAGFSYASLAGSNKHQLTKFALIFAVDNALYVVQNGSLNQATIDFGLDAISTVAWTGNGTKLRKFETLTVANLSAATAYNTSANYITNKLTTMSLTSNIGGIGGTSYNVPITGGSITINNNITYVTPSNLGVVNEPIGYFTGTRSITGSVNAYLRTGSATETSGLLNDVLTGGAENMYKMQMDIGGSTNAVRVELEMPGVTLQTPTVEIADVVSTTINFTAQSYDPQQANNNYDLTQANELFIRYFSA